MKQKIILGLPSLVGDPSRADVAGDDLLIPPESLKRGSMLRSFGRIDELMGFAQAHL